MQGFKSFALSSIFLVAYSSLPTLIQGHGRLWEPPSRNSMWKLDNCGGNPNCKYDYNDVQQNCGGMSTQIQNGGKCGPCGNNYNDPRPRSNENGGTFGTGFIGRRYECGSVQNVTMELTATHGGQWGCDYYCFPDSSVQLESEDPADWHPLVFYGTGLTYETVPLNAPVGKRTREVYIPLEKCERAVLRWYYKTGNNWGDCGDGTGGVGCGPQEWFYGCADVAFDPAPPTDPPMTTRSA